jgi:hypothetical protein
LKSEAVRKAGSKASFAPARRDGFGKKVATTQVLTGCLNISNIGQWLALFNEPFIAIGPENHETS